MMIDQIQRGQGAIRDTGLQKYGALTNILSYYLIGVAFELILCFKFNFASMVFRANVNWQKQGKKSIQRIPKREITIRNYTC